jgi:hypothetical protein
MPLHSRTERRSSGSMKRCANAFSGAHPLQLQVRRRLAVRPHLAKTKVIQAKAEAEERDVVVEETTAKRGIHRQHRASHPDISTTHLVRMHPLDREVAVLSLKEMVPTLKFLNNHYAAPGALTQVEEVASISIAVLEQASVHVTKSYSLQDNGYLLILWKFLILWSQGRPRPALIAFATCDVFGRFSAIR